MARVVSRKVLEKRMTAVRWRNSIVECGTWVVGGCDEEAEIVEEKKTVRCCEMVGVVHMCDKWSMSTFASKAIYV